MQHQIIVFGLMGLFIAGCSSSIDGGGSGASGSSASSNSSSSASGTGGAGGAAGMGGNGGNINAGGMGGGTCGFCDFVCCGETCTNLDNDINNCGACGQKCDATQPYCDNGVCTVPPCSGPLCGPGGTCCGSSCCKPGELCCNVPGPLGVMLGCHAPNTNGTCPAGCTSCECTAPETPIATPNGEKRIDSLVEGDLVYSVHDGAIKAVPIRSTQRNPVTNHFVLRVELVDGRMMEISAGHPTADGHSFGELVKGSNLGGIEVARVQRIPYRHAFTYDILPDSDSGTYFAAGALIGSTMARPAASRDSACPTQ